ncbi:MAG: TonB family protein [Chitinophagales bacterium]
MKNPEIYLHESLEDIIFEDRNQNYGAYTLRRSTNRHLFIGLLIGLLGTSVVSAISLSDKPVADDPEIIVVVTTTDVKVPPKTPELPKPVEPELPKEVAKHAVADFREKVVAKDDDPRTDKDVNTIDDLIGKEIGSENIEGDPFIENPILEPIVEQPKADPEMVRDFSEVSPEYPGGFAALMKDINKNVHYPKFAMDEGIDGTVHLSFIVEKDGSISDVQVMRGIGYGLDEEAIQAVEKLKKWMPGRQGGNPVRVRMRIPIQFELANK